MRIIAIETSALAGSVAALAEDALLRELPLPPEQRSAQTLALGLKILLTEIGWRPADVELVTVAQGPGSFTGLRVGVATAKVLAYAIGCPLLGVNTLQAIASQAPADIASLSVAIEAQRGEVFAARFAADRSWLAAAAIESAEAFLASLTADDAVSGPALESLAARLPPHARVIDRALWAPSAAAIGRIGWRDFRAGRRDDPFQLTPLYLRRTAAEEQWERRGERQG